MFFKNKVLENIISLSLWQLITNTLKFIWLPYVVRVLGTDNYGVFVIAQTLCFYFITINDYGFNLTATREISINRNNKEKLSSIFTSVMLAKVILLFITFIFLLIVILASKKLQENLLIYLYSFGIVVGSSLFPIFIFQGLEKNKYITYIDSISKLISVVLIFLFIRSENDFQKFCIIFSFGYIFSAFIGIISVFIFLNIKISKVNLKDLIYQYKTGFNIFISNIVVNIINQSNSLIIAFYLDNKSVAIYGAADKLRVLFISLYSPIINSFYSKVAYLFDKDKNKYLICIKKIELIIIFFSILILLFINIFSEIIINTIFGNNFDYSSFLLKLFSISIFINGLGFVYSNLFLSVSNNNKFIKDTYICVLLLYLFLLSILVLYQKINLFNLSFSIIISEFFIVIIFYFKYFLDKNNIKKKFEF